MLNLIIFYMLSLTAAGVITAVLNTNRSFSRYFAPAVTAAAGIVLLIFILTGFSGFRSESVVTAWSMPLADFEIGLDSLSLYFMIPLLIVTAAAALYGSQYFKKAPGRLHWLSFSLLVSGMVMVLISRNILLFMLSWEIMSFSSFLLVITDAEKDSIRRAGWIYFITAHVGTACLLAMFFLLGAGTDSLSFSLFGTFPLSIGRSNLILILALIGFGLKAGFIPFHIWLPLAHPAAPSHVSALMSGVMIKMGIYGIIRVLTFLPQPQLWWAVLFIAIGAVSGITGVLYAIGQHDIKRLLAYHSVENIGIIMLGLGVGLLGTAAGKPVISTFGYAGALLHILNHALFKGLLFLGAGSVIRQTGTGGIDRLGGLLKTMPLTGSLFLTASAAITGLPLFNGFISEIFIYAGAASGAAGSAETILPLISALAVLSLALIGGLAAACFTKVFGIVFLGSKREPETDTVSEVPALMKSGMIILALFMLFIGLLSFLTVPFLEKPLLILTGGCSDACLGSVLELTKTISRILPAVLGGIFLFAAAGQLRVRNKSRRTSETWGCGYTRPEASMQYTASSYAEPVTDRFALLLAAKKERAGGSELFPKKPWGFKSGVEDWFLTRIFIKLVRLLDRLLSLLRWFQCGKAGIYVLYITLTVIILFIWMFII